MSFDEPDRPIIPKYRPWSPKPAAGELWIDTIKRRRAAKIAEIAEDFVTARKEAGKKPAKEKAKPKAKVVNLPVKNCLLVGTADGREFFTHEKNLPQLREYARAFVATLSSVSTDGVVPLDLEQLVAALNDPAAGAAGTKYEVVEVRFAPKDATEAPPGGEKTLLRPAVTKYAQERFLAGDRLTAQDVYDHFADRNVTRATIGGYFTKARRELEAGGHRFHKEGRGTYWLAARPDPAPEPGDFDHRIRGDDFLMALEMM